MSIFYAVLGFILAIGILTAVHEYGHFWAARRCGIRVLKFSIGFGWPLVSWYDKYGTEYIIAAVPLGGYVKMLDENEGKVASNQLKLTFNRQPILNKLFVIISGPLFNIIFAAVLYWLIYIIGTVTVIPILGHVPKGSIADIAGLTKGQEIVAIDNQPTKNWEEVAFNLMQHAGDGFVQVTALDRATGDVSKHTANLNNWQLDSSKSILKNFGIVPFDPVVPVVAKVLPDYPAFAAGIKSGDEIISINNIKTTNRMQVTEYVRKRAADNMNFIVKREGEYLNLVVTPTIKLLDGGEEIGFIGIKYKEEPWPKEMLRNNQLGPIAALLKAITQTKQYFLLTVEFLYRMLTGQMSLQNVAGPISIAKFAGQTVSSSLQQFMGFLALISISLGVLNMLPIPILDGGQFVINIVEFIWGRPLPERIDNFSKLVGIFFIVFLIILALYNDFARL